MEWSTLREVVDEENEMAEIIGTTYLRLDQNKIDEEYYQVVLDILVRKAFTSRTLRQTHSLSQRFVIRSAVGGVERLYRQAASSPH